MKPIIRLFAAAIVLAIIASCGNGNRKPLLPNVSGKAGEVIVVLNKYDWEGDLGNDIRELLASDCPFLPQREPLYTLINIAPVNFTNIFQIHRNLVLINVDKSVTDAKVAYRTDVWATPQCVISIDAPDSKTAIELLDENSDTILEMLEQAERNRIIANSIMYEERSLIPVITAFADGAPHFPTGYVLKKQTQDFLWIAYDTQYTMQDVFIYKYPAEGTEDELSLQKIIEKRNEVLKANVPGMFENTYMITSTAADPSLEYIKYNGRHFAQVRGLWEVYNDYMGGPFVSHSFYSRDGKEIIVLEGFVYAPRYDKRNYLRQVESILYSFEWADKEEKE